MSWYKLWWDWLSIVVCWWDTSARAGWGYSKVVLHYSADKPELRFVIVLSLACKCILFVENGLVFADIFLQVSLSSSCTIKICIVRSIHSFALISFGLIMLVNFWKCNLKFFNVHVFCVVIKLFNLCFIYKAMFKLLKINRLLLIQANTIFGDVAPHSNLLLEYGVSQKNKYLHLTTLCYKCQLYQPFMHSQMKRSFIFCEMRQIL